MRKQYQLQDLDCANCAARMEQAIRKIDGVMDVSVQFISQKLTIEAEDGKLDEIMDRVAAVCRRIEPGCVIRR